MIDLCVFGLGGCWMCKRGIVSNEGVWWFLNDIGFFLKVNGINVNVYVVVDYISNLSFFDS